MRIVYLLAYPIYHDGWNTEQWLGMINQNRWIPAVLSEMGLEVELWAGDHRTSTHTSVLPDFPDYTIRLFRTDPVDRRTKYHGSAALVEYARRNPPELTLIKGIDGGVGRQLHREFLRPEMRDFVWVLGGGYYVPDVRDASLIIYESPLQRDQLVRPSGLHRVWRRTVSPDRLIAMPKSVDTDLFRPIETIVKQYDIVSAARLTRRHKSFQELGELSEHLRVAVAGDGPDVRLLRTKYPRIRWLGPVSHQDIPELLNQGRLFWHAGIRERRPTRDFFPRVIAEAMACGVPPVSCDDVAAAEMIPDGCGFRVRRSELARGVGSLLEDHERRRSAAEEARSYAVARLGKRSAAPAMRTMLERLGRR